MPTVAVAAAHGAWLSVPHRVYVTIFNAFRWAAFFLHFAVVVVEVFLFKA